MFLAKVSSIAVVNSEGLVTLCGALEIEVFHPAANTKNGRTEVRDESSNAQD
jgi:hypothetical protein